MPQGLGHSIKTFVQISLPVNSLWASPLHNYFIFAIFTLGGFGGLLSAIIVVIIVAILTMVCWAPNK